MLADRLGLEAAASMVSRLDQTRDITQAAQRSRSTRRVPNRQSRLVCPYAEAMLIGA